MKKELFIILLSFMIALGICAQAGADMYAITGDGQTNVFFYVESYGNARVTFTQNEGKCTELSYTHLWDGITGEEEEWGKYHILILGPSGEYSIQNWDNTFNGSSFSIDLRQAGVYSVQFIPYTASEMTESWTLDKFISWTVQPRWWVSDWTNCRVSETKPGSGQQASGAVTVYSYVNGAIYQSTSVAVNSSRYIDPPYIEGCTCDSGSQYVYFNKTTGACSPSSVSFYYTRKPAYTSGTVIVNMYQGHSYVSTYKETITSSQYIQPRSMKGYTCASGNVYVTFDPNTGLCSPDALYLFYEPASSASSSYTSYGSIAYPTQWDTQYKPGTATHISEGKVDNENRYLNLPYLSDNNPSTSFWWLIWYDERTDDVPEISVYFNRETVSSVGIRNGKLTSQADYYNCARVKRFRVRIFSNIGIEDAYLNLDDVYSRDYQVCSLGKTYRGVTKMEFFLDGGSNKGMYPGNKETYYIHISDMQFYK